jgi:hypothetical protein
MAKGSAPLLLLLIVQLVSVVGDVFGQRCSRVVHGGSRRTFLASMTVVTSLQMLLALSIVQLAIPRVATGITRKFGNESIDVCTLAHNDTRYDADACYAQGPLTLYKVIATCPYVWLNGVMNIVYYVAEASLYREPAGVVLLVIAALASSFLINPMQHFLSLGDGAPLKPASIVLGIIGAVLCVFERDPARHGDHGAGGDASGRPPGIVMLASAEGVDGDVSPTPVESMRAVADTTTTPLPPTTSASAGATTSASAAEGDPTGAPAAGADDTRSAAKLWSAFVATLRIIPVFATLSVAYALWFVLMRLFDEHCSLNMWGYNSVDQVMLPLFVVPLLAVWDALRARGMCKCRGGGGGGGEHADDGHAGGGGGRDALQRASGVNGDAARPGDAAAATSGGCAGCCSCCCGFGDAATSEPLVGIERHHDDAYDTVDLAGRRDGGAGGTESNVSGDDNRAGDGGARDDGSDYDEYAASGGTSFWLTVKTSMRRSARHHGAGFAQMFVYRLFINARAIAYTYIALNYDLAQSYLELTLIRILLSWMASLVCILVVPRFILATAHEALVFRDWLNLTLKCAGSALVVASLVLLKE